MSDDGKTFKVYRGHTALPNQTVRDKSLSYNALGVLMAALSRPEGASQGYRALVRPGSGRDSILRAFKELESGGYRHQNKRRTDSGKVVTDTVISEKPMTRTEADEFFAGKATLAPKTGARSAAPKTGARSTGARKPGALSVPETKVPYRAKAQENQISQKADDRAECRGCTNWHQREDLTTTGHCRDCLMVNAQRPDTGDGPERERVRALLASRRAKGTHPVQQAPALNEAG